MRLVKVIARILKGLYDILATYFLAWILFFAIVALGFHHGLEALAQATGFDTAQVWWRRLEQFLGERGTLWFRLLFFGALHGGLVYLIRGPLARLQRLVETGFDYLVGVFRGLTHDRRRVRMAGQIGFSLVVTLLLVPFVLQPTLVPRYASFEAWLERGANLADGTASRFVADSVVGLYRRVGADAVDTQGGVSDDDFDSAEATLVEPTPKDPDHTPVTPPPTPSGDQPLMDRWDPQIERAAAGDERVFALIKAFMWVESAGRQFAVSTTGCSGLMQFCAGTARSKPFREIFGTGRVVTCQCDGPCSIDKDVRRGLETGEANPDQLGERFPCDPTDTRFDPERAIRAGAVYVTRLDRRFGGNIYLMYIAYNSGPAVANAVYEQLDRDADATLDDIELHLADAMRPHYGAGSKRRARSLLRTHLPKIKRAYDRYAPKPSSESLALREGE
jgi:hypothetical protein